MLRSEVNIAYYQALTAGARAATLKFDRRGLDGTPSADAK